METLNDPRYKFVDTPEEAQICWLLSLDRNTLKSKAQGKYLNEFHSDEVLLVKDLMISLMHSTYKCFRKEEQVAIPESYLTMAHLPAFVGRYKELEKSDLWSTWSISGPIPNVAPSLT